MYVKYLLPVLFLCFPACQSSSKKPRGSSAGSGANSASSQRNVSAAPKEISDKSEVDVKFWLSKDELRSKYKAAVENAKKNIDDPNAFVEVANLAFLLGQVKTGRVACKRALKLLPGFPSGLLSCARIEYIDENYDLAELTLDKLKKKNQSKSIVIELRAMIALKRGDVNEASRLYGKAVEASPRNLKLKLNVGLLLLKYRQIEAAKTMFQNVLKADEDNSISKLHLGIILVSENKGKDALKLFEDVEDDERLSDYAHFHTARVYELQGEFEKSAEALAKINPKNNDEKLRLSSSRLTSRVNTFKALKGQLGQKVENRKKYNRYLAEKKKLDEIKKKKEAAKQKREDVKKKADALKKGEKK